MSGEIHIVVLGNAVAKGRPKFTRAGGFPRAYTPAKTVKWENIVRTEAAAVMADRPIITGPVFLVAKFVRPFPVGMSGKKRLTAYPTTKPDLTNYIKAIEDACNGVVWKDDSQIVNMGVWKEYGDKPLVDIKISEIGGQ